MVSCGLRRLLISRCRVGSASASPQCSIRRRTSSVTYTSRPIANIPRDAVVAVQYRLRPKREGTRAGSRASLPADLAAFVLFFEPAHKRFEVFHHRARGNVFADRFSQNLHGIRLDFWATFYLDCGVPVDDEVTSLTGGRRKRAKRPGVYYNALERPYSRRKVHRLRHKRRSKNFAGRTGDQSTASCGDRALDPKKRRISLKGFLPCCSNAGT